MNQSKKTIKNEAKLESIMRSNRETWCYCKVGRKITKLGAIEESPILLSHYWKK